jgi:3-isopropylmalate dehydrogenase
MANPLATILSVAMMLRYTLNESALAERVERAVARVLDGGLRTGDIFTEGMKRVGTRQMGEAVVNALSRDSAPNVTASERG